MVDKFLKDYNDLFTDELNKSKVVQSYIGPIKPNNIHRLHSVMHFTWLHVLYSHFPTKLSFGKFFFLFTKPQSTIDMFEINNYHKVKKERVKLNSTRPKKKKSIIRSLKETALLNN